MDFNDGKVAQSVKGPQQETLFSEKHNAFTTSEPKNKEPLSLRIKDNLRSSIAISEVNYDWKFENYPRNEQALMV